jgi:hypothetical protein
VLRPMTIGLPYRSLHQNVSLDQATMPGRGSRVLTKCADAFWNTNRLSVDFDRAAPSPHRYVVPRRVEFQTAFW